MRCAIVGDRDCDSRDIHFIKKAIEASGFEITEVVSGGAKGADTLAENWARENGVKLTVFKADWKNLDAPNANIKTGAYGKYNANAGFDRNAEIVNYVGKDGCCIALQPNGQTPGTSNTVSQFKKQGTPIFIYPDKLTIESEFAYSF